MPSPSSSSSTYGQKPLYYGTSKKSPIYYGSAQTPMYYGGSGHAPYYYGGEGMRLAVVQLMPFILLFNLIKWAGNSVITLLIYKRISPFLHKA